MPDNDETRGAAPESAESNGVFDLFEDRPERDPSSFGKVPVVKEDEIDLRDSSAELKAAADAEAAGLQHWTAPPTGQVPAVLSGEVEGGNGRWGAVSGPSWNEGDSAWDGPDLADVFADTSAVSVDEVVVDDDDDEGEYGDAFDQAAVERPVRTAARTALEDDPTIPPPSSTDSTAAPSMSDEPDRPRRSTPTSDESPAGPRSGSARARAAARRPADPEGSSSSGSLADGPPVARPRPASEPSLDDIRFVGGDLDEEPSPSETRSESRSDSVPRSRSADTSRSDAQSRQEAAAGREVADADGPSRSGKARPTADGGSVATSSGAPKPRPDLDDENDDDDAYDEYDQEIGLAPVGGRNLPQAIGVGVGLAAIVLVAMFIGPIATLVLVAVLAILAVLELYNAMRMAGLRPATLLGLVGTVAAPAAAFYRGDAAFPLIVGLAVVFGTLWYLVGADTERPVLNLSLTMMGIFWIGGLAGFAALMVRLDGGIQLLLATIIITVASDTMAYIGGRAYGSRPFHQASPNKTWEGTMTGLFGSIFAGFAIGITEMGTIWDDRLLAAVALGAVVGILAPMGDLAESVVKRDLGVKDMGTLLPGHGGVLDRIDGLLFALPGAYYLALVYGLI